jgi:hypothetical protein
MTCRQQQQQQQQQQQEAEGRQVQEDRTAGERSTVWRVGTAWVVLEVTAAGGPGAGIKDCDRKLKVNSWLHAAASHTPAAS